MTAPWKASKLLSDVRILRNQTKVTLPELHFIPFWPASVMRNRNFCCKYYNSLFPLPSWQFQTEGSRPATSQTAGTGKKNKPPTMAFKCTSKYDDVLCIVGNVDLYIAIFSILLIFCSVVCAKTTNVRKERPAGRHPRWLE